MPAKTTKPRIGEKRIVTIESVAITSSLIRNSSFDLKYELKALIDDDAVAVRRSKNVPPKIYSLVYWLSLPLVKEGK